MTDNENNLAKDINVPHKEQIIIDGVDVSNFCLVCYYDNKTNKLTHIEQYHDMTLLMTSSTLLIK